MTDTVRVPREPTEVMLQGACDKHKPGQPISEDRPEECPRFQTRRRIYRAMLAASHQGEGSSGEWITHDSGPNPVPGKQVIVRFPDGDESVALDSECFDWSVPFLGVPEATIIAYRVTEGVKTSADTGELRERVAQIIEAAIERHNPGNSLRHTLDDADAILDLIQSERAG